MRPFTRVRLVLRLRACAIIALGLAGCGDGTGPGDRRVAIAVAAGNDQRTVPGRMLDFPLEARVVDADRGTPVADAAVSWRVTAGGGAIVQSIDAESNDLGIAAAQLTLGPDTGTYRVEATTPNRVGGAAVFAARAVLQPVIHDVSPATAPAGSTITIDGQNFSTVAAENHVLFDGWRGHVTAATTTRLTVEVPACVLTRDAELIVALGGAWSEPVTIRTIAGSVTTLALGRGAIQSFTDAAALACIALPDDQPGARYLVVSQNAGQRVDLAMRYELTAIDGAAIPVTIAGRPPSPSYTAALAWETALRHRERALDGFAPLASADAANAARTIPAIGERRSFNVLIPGNESRRVTAEVRVISDHAIIYVDLEAPGNGFTLADLQRFAQIFDDPIYATDTSVYGPPSDIDDNDRVIILFTPAVNALTERNQSGFIAGYFYGCDLLAPSRCSPSNQGEIFYGIVPDPGGQFSSPRSKDTVLRTVPGVLAHEFQHMIHFAARGQTLDLLWLSEALAHMAEDLVGEEFAARGDLVSANDFRRPNWVRTQLYLAETATTTLVAEAAPGSLEQRGAAWLFLKYLTGHYGGTTLLGRLTNSTATGVANVTGAVSRPWQSLLAEYAVALWADGASELAGVPLDARLTFADFDLRATIGLIPGGFPLQPPRLAFENFQFVGELATGGSDYLFLDAFSAPPPFHFAFTGVYGGPFANATAPQLTVLRVR